MRNVGYTGLAFITLHESFCKSRGDGWFKELDNLDQCTCVPIRFRHNDPRPSVYFAARLLNPTNHGDANYGCNSCRQST
jgi:hypothetical protein